MATSRKHGWLNRVFVRRQQAARRKTPYGCRLGIEPLEDRRMLFVPYGGGAVWGTTDLTFSYSNMLDGTWTSGLTNQVLTQAAEEAMGIWASVTPLTFTQTGDSGPAPSDSLYDALTHPLIRWGHHFIDGGPVPMMTNTVAHAYRPGTNGRNGDIHFDNGDTFTADLFLETAAHEIGHTLGLDHANGEATATMCPPAFAAIMHACIGGGGTWDYTGLGTAFLLQDDIDGIRSLYDAGLGYVLNSTGQLSVFGTNQDDFFNVAYDFGTNMLTVTNGVNSFTRTMSGVLQVAINGQGGDDTILVNALPSQVITVVNGGAGNDNLTLRGSQGGDTLRLDNGTTAYNNNSPILFSDISTVTLSGHGGADVLEVVQSPANLPVTINGGDDNDTITLGPSPFASQVILSPVTVFGDAGNDTLILGSNNADSIDANVTFNGGMSLGGLGDRIIFNDFAPSYNISYDVAPTFVVRDGISLPHTVSYSSTEGIVINAGSGADTVTVRNAVTALVTANGNNGNDNFIVGGGNMAGYVPQLFDGGLGIDQITFDDHLNPAGKLWDINQDFHPDEIIYSGLITLPTTGFESVGILAGMGIDNITFYNDIRQNYSVNGGALNSNIFRWNAANNYFRNPDGPDASYAVDLVVGPQFAGNLLLFEDFSRLETDYYVSDSLVSGFDTFTSLDGFDVTYHNADFLTINGSNERNTFQLASAHPDTSYSFFARGGNDRFDLTLDPAVGGQSIRTDGNDGSDSLFITDATFSAPSSYAITSSSLTRTSGGGSRFFSLNTIESISVTGTTGDDTFGVGTFSSGAGLVVRGADGDDTLNFGNGSLAANITNMAAFAFNGQDGFDRFNLHNTTDIGNWTYTRNTASIQAIRAGYGGLFLSESAIEEMTVNAGPGGDTFLASGNSSGTHTIFNGAGGQDTLQAGTVGGLTSSVQGPITFDAGTPSPLHGGTMNVSSAAHGDAKTAHMTASTLGAHPDDNLFGAGGSLEFFNITALNLTLGTGPDTVYAQPLADATVQIVGNNPTTLPGDTLNLDLANAVNYVITPTSATAGNVTSDNLQMLTYSGFESGPNIDDVPDVSIFVVDTLDDENDGDYSEGDLSLREAVRFANFTSEIDSIAFSAALSGGAIVLTLGELQILRSVPIIGLGALLLTIDASGNDPTPAVNNGDGSRVFNIDDGNLFANIDVEIVGLTLTGGDVTGSGGGILTREDLTITSSTISDNAATTGGGFHSIGGNLTVASSTISGNAANSNGGGIYSQSVSLTVTNSTISGNTAKSNGGGISTPYGGVSLAHSTITGNVADADHNNSGMGGGIAVFDNPYYSSVNVELDHVILAGNIRGISTRSDVFGLIIDGTRFSLIGDRTGVSNIIDNGGNLIGTSSSPIDPLLGLLADNGGPTMTHALLVGSPAINAGDAAAVAGVGGVPLYDQRGATYARVAGGRLDIGAFEVQSVVVEPALPGDYNQSGVVDAADYTVWRDTLGSSVALYDGADGDGSGIVDTADYDVWKANFGAALGGAASTQTAADAVTMHEQAVARVAAPVAEEKLTINALNDATAVSPNGQLRTLDARQTCDRAFAAYVGPLGPASTTGRPRTAPRAASLQSTPQSVAVNSRAVELLLSNPLFDSTSKRSTSVAVRRPNSDMIDNPVPARDEFFSTLSGADDVSRLVHVAC